MLDQVFEVQGRLRRERNDRIETAKKRQYECAKYYRRKKRNRGEIPKSEQYLQTHI